MAKSEGDGGGPGSWDFETVLRRHAERLDKLELSIPQKGTTPPMARDVPPSWHERHLKEMALATGQDRDVLAQIYRCGPASTVGRPVVAPLLQGEIEGTELRPACCVAVLMAYQLVTFEWARAPGVLPAVLNAECRRLGVPTDHRVIADLRAWQRRWQGLMVPDPLKSGDRVSLLMLPDGQLCPGAKATCQHAIEVLRQATAMWRLKFAGPLGGPRR